MVSNGARRVGACQSARAGRSAPLAVSGLLTFGLLLLLLLAPSAARGATELGQLQPVALHQSCNGTNNLVQSASDPAVTYVVPAGGGVLTSWRHQANPTTVATARLQVWRHQGGDSYLLHDRSELETLAAGTLNEFPTRIPVSGGEMLGFRTDGMLGCVSEDVLSSTDVLTTDEGGTASEVAPGETRLLEGSFPMQRINVAATLEPDADGDGFGDESQDVALAIELKNRLRAKRSGFPVSISCGGSDCEGTLEGTVVAKQTGGSKDAAAAKKRKKKFKLAPMTLSVAAGVTEATTLKLQKNTKSSKKLRRLLKSDRSYRRGSRLKVNVSATNSLGSSDATKDKAKLKP